MDMRTPWVFLLLVGLGITKGSNFCKKFSGSQTIQIAQEVGEIYELHVRHNLKVCYFLINNINAFFVTYI